MQPRPLSTRALTRCPPSLSRIRLTPQLVTQLCRALKHPHCVLQDLRVAWCGIDDAGMEQLAQALSSDHCQLRWLDVYGNGFRRSDGLCQALVHPNCLLVDLVWASNQLASPHEAKLLAHAVLARRVHNILVALVSDRTGQFPLAVELVRLLGEFLLV